MTGAGGTLVAPSLGLYGVPTQPPRGVVRALRARGALRFSTPNRPAGSLAVTDFADPLVPTEWWRPADRRRRPHAAACRAGPSRSSTRASTSRHPEFLGRANTETLNAQEPAGIGGEHGTAVASLVAAPANGLGLVGIYPEALFRSWDAAKGQGTRARRRARSCRESSPRRTAGPGIVNLSLGSDDRELAIEQAVYEAVSEGHARRRRLGQRRRHGQPARLPGQHSPRPHRRRERPSERDRRVLEPVALRRPRRARRRHPDRDGAREGLARRATARASPPRSSRAPAPGSGRCGPELDATPAVRGDAPLGRRHRRRRAGTTPRASGSSTSPPRSPTPPRSRDPFEPNDDIEFVQPGRALRQLHSAADDAGQARRRPSQARLDRAEDPATSTASGCRRNGRVTATLTADANLDLSLWKQGTVSVIERIVGKDRLARAIGAGDERAAHVREQGRRAGSRILAVVFAEGRPRRRRTASASPAASGVGARPTTAAYSTGGSSTTSGLRTRTRTAVTGKPADERVGERRREGLEQVIGAGVGDLARRGRRPRR